MDVHPTDTAQGSSPVRPDVSKAADIYTMTPEGLKNHFLQAVADHWKAKMADLNIRTPRYAAFKKSDNGSIVCPVSHGAEDVPVAVVTQLRVLCMSSPIRFEDMMALLRADVCEIEFEGGVVSLKPMEMEGISGAVNMLAELGPMFAQLAVGSPTNGKLLPNALDSNIVVVDANGLSSGATL